MINRMKMVPVLKLILFGMIRPPSLRYQFPPSQPLPPKKYSRISGVVAESHALAPGYLYLEAPDDISKTPLKQLEPRMCASEINYSQCYPRYSESTGVKGFQINLDYKSYKHRLL